MFRLTRSLSLLMLSVVLAACAGSQTEKGFGPLVASSNARGVVAVSASGRPAGRQIIHSARLELEDRDVAKIAKRAAEIARQLGGHVAHSRNGGDAVRLRLRVPAPRFPAALSQLEQLAEVKSRQLRGEDVTTRVVDLKLRLSTALAARKRYLELLARANSVAEALPVQKELSKVVAEIERLEAQIARVERQVRLATIELKVERPVRPGVVGWIFYGVYRGVKWLFVWD